MLYKIAKIGRSSNSVSSRNSVFAASLARNIANGSLTDSRSALSVSLFNSRKKHGCNISEAANKNASHNKPGPKRRDSPAVGGYGRVLKAALLLGDGKGTSGRFCPHDPVRAESINHLVLRLRDELKVTGVAVTHDIVSAYRIANRIAMLHEGLIYKVGTPQEIQDCADPVVRNFVTGVGVQNEEVSLG